MGNICFYFIQLHNIGLSLSQRIVNVRGFSPLLKLEGRIGIIDKRKDTKFKKRLSDNDYIDIKVQKNILQPVEIVSIHAKMIIGRFRGTYKILTYVSQDGNCVVFHDYRQIWLYSRKTDDFVGLKIKPFGLYYNLQCKYYHHEKLLVVGTGLIDNSVFIIRIDKEISYAEFKGYHDAVKLDNKIFLLSNTDIGSKFIEISQIAFNGLTESYKCTVNCEELE